MESKALAFAWVSTLTLETKITRQFQIDSVLGDAPPESPAPVRQPNIHEIVIRAEPDGVAPPDLKRVYFVSSEKATYLRFVVKNQEQQVDVFNEFGDQIATLSSNKRNLWQRVIDKEHLLNLGFGDSKPRIQELKNLSLVTNWPTSLSYVG